MKIHVKLARYFLGVWFLICAVDGWLAIFFDIHISGDLTEFKLLESLVTTIYFWAFLKVMQTVVAISLLANYKPALGLALATPIATVLCLFYLFELQPYIPIGVMIVLSIVAMGQAYSESYIGMLKNYPR